MVHEQACFWHIGRAKNHLVEACPEQALSFFYVVQDVVGQSGDRYTQADARTQEDVAFIDENGLANEP
jgi:hypothetical protein